MLPFDRLIAAMDQWAFSHPEFEIQAQIGMANYFPSAFAWTSLLSPRDFRTRCEQAELIVAHAGMGTILSCLKARRPLIVLPRHAALREVNNDHQLATAKWLSDREHMTVAHDVPTLFKILDSPENWHCSQGIPEYASRQLIERVRSFILY